MKFEFKNTFLFFSILLFSFGCSSKKKITNTSVANASEISNATFNETKFKTGAENYTSYLTLLTNKKIGIVTNPTGILENKKHLVDFLLEKQINVQKIYAPEHGFRGTADAGEKLLKTGKTLKQIYRLFRYMEITKSRKPEQLSWY